jgi:Ca2+-binding RTX toxin-like protein
MRGGNGYDRLYGGSGNDRLYGDSHNDYPYGGTGRDYLYGEVGNDYLYGENSNDRLYGSSGNDRLYGGSGNDRLYGGPGKDIFVFDRNKPSKSANLDTIYDYSRSQDTLWLDNRYLTKLRGGSESRPKKLSSKYFTAGTKAKDKNDYLIYNKKTKTLYYDKDGSGSSKAVELFKFNKDVGLKYSEIYII